MTENDVERAVEQAAPAGTPQILVGRLSAQIWRIVQAKLSEGVQAAQDELRSQIRAIPGELKRGCKEVLFGIPPDEYDRRHGGGGRRGKTTKSGAGGDTDEHRDTAKENRRLDR